MLGSDKLVRYSLLAGESALAAHAPEQALAHFERALAANGDEATATTRPQSSCFGLGRAQLGDAPTLRAGARDRQLAARLRPLRRGRVTWAARSPSPPIRSPCLCGFGYTDFRRADRARLVSRAARLSRGGTHCSPSTAGSPASSRPTTTERNAPSEQALSIAVREDDARPGTEDACQRRLRRRVPSPLAGLSRREGCGRSSWSQHAGDAAHRDHRPPSGRICPRGNGRARAGRAFTPRRPSRSPRQLRESWWLTSTSFNNQLLCLYEGDWRAAREMSERRPGCGAARSPAPGAAGRARVRARRLSTQARRTSRGCKRWPPACRRRGRSWTTLFVAAVIPLVGRIAGDRQGFGRRPRRVAACPLAAVGSLLPWRLYARSGLALIAVAAWRCRRRERRCYGTLETERGTASFFVPLTFDRLLGLLAAARGRVDAALAHFADGLAFCDRAGYRPEYAWTAFDYADVLLRAGRRRRPGEGGRPPGRSARDRARPRHAPPDGARARSQEASEGLACFGGERLGRVEARARARPAAARGPSARPGRRRRARPPRRGRGPRRGRTPARPAPRRSASRRPPRRRRRPPRARPRPPGRSRCRGRCPRARSRERRSRPTCAGSARRCPRAGGSGRRARAARGTAGAAAAMLDGGARRPRRRRARPARSRARRRPVWRSCAPCAPRAPRGSLRRS